MDTHNGRKNLKQMARKKTQHNISSNPVDQKKLEVVLKCDVAGTAEAVSASLAEINVPGVQIDLIQTGIGNVSKSDVLMARTGSKLVLGFSVGTMPKLEQEIKEYGVEVRLYDTIYKLIEDMRKIAQSFIIKEAEEKITAKAKVIATFRSSPKGAVIGCEVLEGRIELGNEFRVITAMGPAYFGKITSLQIERQNVKTAKPGQQVGIKLEGWNKAKVDDLVECYESIQPKGGSRWKPRSGIIRSIS
jgi:translation initiation factor IF-2